MDFLGFNVVISRSYEAFGQSTDVSGSPGIEKSLREVPLQRWQVWRDGHGPSRETPRFRGVYIKIE